MPNSLPDAGRPDKIKGWAILIVCGGSPLQSILELPLTQKTAKSNTSCRRSLDKRFTIAATCSATDSQVLVLAFHTTINCSGDSVHNAMDSPSGLVNYTS